MGFLEKLRQQKDVEQRAREARRLQEQEYAARAEVLRRRQDEEERNLRQERQRQANRFYQESGVGNLLSELRNLMPERSKAIILERSFGRYIPIYPDPDSVVFKMEWGERYLGSAGGYAGRYSEKFIAIEITPIGTINFHAGLFGSSKISIEKWRNNKNLLEDALEKAYKYHGTSLWKESFLPPISNMR